MSSSIAETLAATKADGRAALIAYFVSGYPTLEISCACVAAAVDAGADIIELGIPFSDPVMDGPTIQRASASVLASGVTVRDHLDSAATLSTEVDVPLAAMTYYTIAHRRGLSVFAKELAAAGISGAILPDLPAHLGDWWRAAAREHDIDTVFLASSVSTDERLAQIAQISQGFIYATGLLGVTGVKTVDDSARTLVERIRPHTDTPVCVGVGVSTPAQAQSVAEFADGVIVGSAIVKAVGDGDPEGAPERVHKTVSSLRAGIDAASG